MGMGLSDGSCLQPDSALLQGAAQSIVDGSRSLVTIQIEVTERLRRSMSGYGIEHLESVFITDSDIRHIMRRHSSNEGSRGQIAIEPSDFALLPEILGSFDTCEHTDTDKLGNKKFLITKRIGNMFYVVTVQRGPRKLEVKTMWKSRVPRASRNRLPWAYVRNDPGVKGIIPWCLIGPEGNEGSFDERSIRFRWV